ncbi:DUF86 domain-containing protein, partial [Candidatus Woesearchaeota archaeon]|nr:DUF86 domain-containing protein [Candidatus Woesearchaeota archaeon]
DKDIQDATIRRIELIGEAVKHLPPGLKQRYPQVKWKEIAGARDVLIMLISVSFWTRFGSP